MDVITYPSPYPRISIVGSLENKNIKNNAWVTVNNDFWVMSEAICQWFSRVTKSQVKIIAESLHEWQKSLFAVTKVLSYYLHVILCHEHTDPLSSELSSSANFAIVSKGSLFWLTIVKSLQLICDVMWTRDTGIVTSYSSIVIACANWQIYLNQCWTNTLKHTCGTRGRWVNI